MAKKLAWGAPLAGTVVFLLAVQLGRTFLNTGHVSGAVVAGVRVLFVLPLFGLVGLGATVRRWRDGGRASSLFVWGLLNLAFVGVPLVILLGLGLAS